MTTTSLDPASTAQQLATAYTTNAQALLTTKTKEAQATSTALTKMRSALTTFDSAIASLSAKKSVIKFAATFSSTANGTATASATAQPGSYSFFVEKLASTHQVAFANMADAAETGTLGLSLADGTSFSVNFSGADADSNGQLSPAEMARAINNTAGNAGSVVASVITSGGSTQLVLSSGKSGAGGAVSLDTSGLTDATLKTKLAGGNTLVAAQDAVVWLGDQTTGVRMQQSSNTFTAVQGVTINFTKAMATGEAPVTLTVTNDSSGTASNVRSFVDAYNALRSTLADLTKTANKDTGAAAGAFASDASVRSMISRLGNMVRQEVGGMKLADYGITLDRSGQMQLDATKLEKALAAKPTGLDTLFGSSSATAPSGIFGAIDKYLEQWTNSANGQIKARQDSVALTQKSLTSRQTRLDTQYDNLYQRYLAQFTKLQTLQQSMSETTNLFTSLSS
ncbi:flagellar filament capping protein FliD [Aquincola tertiaricarbonis]|uniref:Flagellar hook-associated protein 2 n=1 Tax=Aquincola tertiaricarbonis TaxID=391953 RepID=A0ABY4S138_AQUTE|nr:flagellar filament capping protein FliD [Aquincola tertiaricarbonis]URI06265.1 flagellar filament capping protein FliD [Aquincola tertiaricarbonis]